MSEITKALSVRAPWWWLILYAGKDMENRDWSTKFRGVVWLHAGQWWKDEEVRMDWDDAEMMSGKSITMPNAEEMRKYGGCIVGSVEIVDCVDSSTSNWFVGKYGFVLRNPVPLAEPVPFKGALGFFSVPDDLIGDAA